MTPSVTFSLCGTTGLTWPEIREAVTMADELGFDGYYTSDHLIPNTQIGATNSMLEAYTALSAVAMLTKRIRLGVMFSPVLFRHPAMLAKMIATALFVVIIALISERIGPFFGAMVASLPIYSGPIYLVLAFEHTPDYLAQAALGSVAISGAMGSVSV